MADLDRLLSDDPGAVVRSAEEAAAVPDFAAVVRRGRARRTRRQAGVLGAAALAVIGIVGSVQLLGQGGGEPSPAPPVVSPSAPPSVPTTAPADSADELARAVDAGDAALLGLASTPGDPAQRITVWRGVDEQHWILALTADDFTHRRLVEVSAGTIAVPLGAGRFVLRDGWEGRNLSIVDVAGGTTPVRVDATPAPVAADEVPVVLSDGATPSLVAVAADGTGHEVPSPAGPGDLTAYAGRLSAVRWQDATVTYHWSDDGGATWEQAGLDGSFLPAVAYAGAGGPHVVLEGGDGATLFPLQAVDTASAADPHDWTRAPVERGEQSPTVSGSWIDRDGQLRVLASMWDQGGGTPVDAGVWRVTDGRLVKVASNLPGIADLADIGLLTVEDDGGPVLWVAAPDGSAWRSTDDGVTWARFATR